ncbi:MAG: cytochrome c3 family protein [Acidobacteria bacterium]|uniref:Cytochrome c3 family protein n=1 Tax=Candidatus Polarisedimenticola svalbardensis TaxID=2886004 RepID=A0A8J6XSN7_9BACT|nr:cytochrome c3 family protein [Candidatus Polarisedimenticola svalbardensis]
MMKLAPRLPLRRRFLQGIAWSLVTCAIALGQGSDIANTPHNLSASGPGSIKATSETEICKFCHVPHNSRSAEALWAQQLSEAIYRTPPIRTGESQLQTAPQPGGSSRLCLSCHDGTVAMGEISGSRGRIRMAGRQKFQPGDPGYLGTDLSGSHPVSFEISARPIGAESPAIDIGLHEVSAIISNTVAPLDANNKMQCTTCHDPHSDAYYRPGIVPRFWVAPTVQEVCTSCHALR